jgi:hypothetical protein
MSVRQLMPPQSTSGKDWGIGKLTLGACFVYSSTVKEPTEVSNVTYSAPLIVERLFLLAV